MSLDLRIGQGMDVHKMAEGEKFSLGGITIPHTKGCIAHSDGDTLIHALCDAIFGALALGDIGQHFPDTDEQYRCIDSKELLLKVVSLMHEKQYRIQNMDATVVLQKPKIQPYIPEMRTVLADLLKTNVEQVSIKATTSEHLGFTGREEGLAAFVVVLLVK